MAVLATDDFNRAGPALGANWTPYGAATFVIASSTVVQPNSFASDAQAAYTAATWPNDQYAQVTVGTLVAGGASSGLGVMLRGTSATAMYRIVVHGAGASNVELARINPGYTALQNQTVTFNAGDILYAEIQGSTIKIFRNGTQIGSSYVDASPITSGNAGIAYSSTMTSGTIDDFIGGDFTSGVTQAARPDADTTTTGWTATPLWSKINEAVADGTIITATAA